MDSESLENWTLIDTETDGLTSPIHILDFAAQKFRGLTPVGEPFQIFIDHGIEIPPEATAVHGYTTTFIAENGIAPSDAYRQIREFVANDVLSAHYLVYDWDRVLVPELRRLNEISVGERGFCTWLLSRRSLPEHPTHKLDYLRDQHGLACSRPHSALGDVESVCDLLTRIVFPRLQNIGFNSLARVREFTALRPPLRCKCLIEGLDYDEEVRKIAEAKREARLLQKLLFEVELGDHPLPVICTGKNGHEILLERELKNEATTT